MPHRRRSRIPPRTDEERAGRDEARAGLELARSVRQRVADQWPEVLQGARITQPRLDANGFTDAVALTFYMHRRSA